MVGVRVGHGGMLGKVVHGGAGEDEEKDGERWEEVKEREEVWRVGRMGSEGLVN